MSLDKEPRIPPLPGAADTKGSDQRAEFAKRSTGKVSPEAERAFIKARLDMVRSNQTLGQREKELAIKELESRLRLIDELKESETDG